MRIVSGITLILLLLSMLTLAFNIQPVEAEPTTIIVPDDYEKIQWAIGNASDGDTIFVRAGTYYEQVVVNKSVSLIGEDEIATTAVITNAPEAESAVCISANNVTISGFEIRNSGGWWGIILNHSSNSTIHGNTVKSVLAILVEGGSGNNISDNRIEKIPISCIFDGLNLRNSDNNVVTGNNFSGYCHNALTMSNSNNNYIAFNLIAGHSTTTVTLWDSNNNSIVGNAIWGDPQMGHVSFLISNSNVLYHNSFRVDGEPVKIWIDETSMNNTWDDGYLSGGNYWDDYSGVDADGDGIGDTPYLIDVDNQDNYPLMNPWIPIPGNVAGDSIVNIFDIGAISAHWYPGPPIGPLGYDADCDLNNDDAIDILDIEIASDHWGET